MATLIVFEGIDGSGKTTQGKLLSENLKSLGLKVQLSSEPTDGPVGTLIKQKILREGSISLPLSNALLFAADRALHLKDINLTEKNFIYILDRYFYSSLAYQGACGVPLSYIEFINSFAPKPDLVFLLDIDPAIGLSRLKQFDKFENLSYLNKVRKLYLYLANKYNMIVFDATEKSEVLAKKIFDVVKKKLGINCK